MCACLWTALFLLAGPLSNTAAAQTFKLNLDDLRTLYDDMFPERIGRAVWDTTGTVDHSTLEIGNVGYKVPTFIPFDDGRNQTIVEYGAIYGYRITYTVPRTYAFANRDSAAGEYILMTPRDATIPGLEIDITPLDTVVATVERESQREVWRRTSIDAIEAQRNLRRGSGQTGITIDIPLPMPKQLESIFGPSEKTHINITGREEITFAGETRRVNPYIGVEGRQRQSLFPALDMKQTLDVRLTGTIGDKVNIQVDHSSEGLSDDANRIRLNYTGYEDDVIQLIELGNTSLSLPGSQLVSISTQSKGLFGVKVLAQLGSTDITVIASKQQGETSSASFSPTAGSIGTTEKVVRADVDYVKDKYFFFNHSSIAYNSNLLPDQGQRIDIYREVKPQEVGNDSEVIPTFGRAFVDSSGTGEWIAALVTPLASGVFPPDTLGNGYLVPSVRAQWQLLTLGVDYSFILDANTLDPIGIELSRPILDGENRALAAAYTTADGRVVGGQNYNSLLPQNQQIDPDSLALKLIKSRQVRPTGDYGYLWNYMMRNIYSLGLSNIDPATFRLDIVDNIVPRVNATTPDSVDVPYTRIFGLDRYTTTGELGSDGLVDLRAGVVDLQDGTIMFPSLTPFAPTPAEVASFTGGDFAFDDPQYNDRFIDQYDKSKKLYESYITDQEIGNLHQYTIEVEAVSTTKTFRINAANIIEGSEVVTLDGNRLSPGIDYDITYETGEVELKGNVLNTLTASSKIDIDYEYKPFGGGGSSSLVGFNTLTKIGQNARLGTTWLYESKNVTADKPRLGEEPSRAVVGGVNGSVQHDSRFLTDLVNKLPLVDTDGISTINLGGEVAMSMPDPNTRGEAYIDDFEGVEDSDRISMTRSTWHEASLPVVEKAGGGTETVAPDKRLNKFLWYNIEPSLAPHKKDFNPDLDDKENNAVAALDIELDPALPASDDTTSFAGVMTGFGGGGLDLTQGQFIEVWVNDFKPDPLQRGGQLHIDFGAMDENFFRPDSSGFDDEDYGHDGWAAGFDDTGLDGEFNWQDPDKPTRTTEDGANKDDDKNGDDYSADRIGGRLVRINGTEKNNQYDTEDLDHNGQLDRTNSYYSFVINLADSAVIDIREQFGNHPYIQNLGTEKENDSWRLYRIKLSDAAVVSPSGAPPEIDQVRHMRVWFNDVNSVVRTEPGAGLRRLQIAELKIVGNRWQEDGVRNLQDKLVTTSGGEFAVGVISTKSDPGIYNPPVRPNVNNEVADKETSLFLRYDNIDDSTQVRIFKRFSGNGIDMTLYRDFHFWVHTDQLDPDLTYYLRLGTNETNFYEIAVPFKPEYFNATGWANVGINLADLSDLKFAPADSAVYGSAQDLEEDRTYPITMVGAPSLFNVRYLYAGLRNRSPTKTPHSGEIWLDDIFVGAVKRDVDFAQRANASVSLGGGVLSLNGNWTRTGPDFRGLRQRRGGGSLVEAYSLNAKTNLLHFVPLFGFSIPLSGNYRKQVTRPKFVPNSDTEITDAALQDSLQSVIVSRGFATSIGKKGSKNVLLKYSIDKISTNFSYSKTEARAPASADTSTAMNGTVGYQITWQGRHALKLWKKQAFRYWPNSFEIRTAATRRTAKRWRFIGDEYKPDPYQFAATLNNSGSVNYSPFKSVTSSFSMGIDRDLNRPHEWYGVDVGTEVRRNHNLKATYRPPDIRFIKEFSPDFSLTTGYGEDASPGVRRPGDPRGLRNVNAGRTLSAKTRVDVGKGLRIVFRKVGIQIEGPNQKKARERREAREQQRANDTQGTQGEPADSLGVPPVPPGGDEDGVGAGGAGATPPAAPAAADTSKAGGSKADPLLAVRKLAQILTDVRKVNFNVSQRDGTNYSRIPDRPSLMYQLGFDPDTGLPNFDEPERSNKNINLSADSGVQLSDDIDVAARYSRTVADNDFRENQSRSTSTTFPDFQVSWKGLEKIPLFRPLFNTTQANFNIKKFSQESGRRDAPEPDNRRETLTLAPSLLFTWKNDMKSTLGVAYNKNTNETRGAVSETSNLSVNLDFKKSFSGGTGFKLPIPLFRKEIKWKSRLDSNLSIAYARTGGKRYTQTSELSQPIPGTTSIRVSPNVAYTFSQSLSGRAFIDYGRSYNEATAQTTTTVRIGVTAVFTF